MDRVHHITVSILLSGVLGFGVLPAGIAQTVQPPFNTDYSVVDLGPVPSLPPSYGGLTFKYDDPHTLLIGGKANAADGALYSIGVARDAQGRITNFTGTAASFAAAAFNDGGVVYGPDNVLFLARWNPNEIGQTKPGSAVTDKIVSLAPLGVTSGPGGLMFVPPGFPGAGRLKLAAYSDQKWYDLSIASDGAGTFDILSATNIVTLVGSPEGIAYVPPGSPQFTPFGHVLICEFGFGAISAYQLDSNGDPVAGTRTPFLTGLTGVTGAALDPLTGDLLFSTFGGGSRVVVVRGFAPPQPAVQFLGPCPYLCFNQSPFAGLSCGSFQLETFESGTLSVTGVTVSTGAPYGPDGITDAVDCDDGAIDGSGTAGRSFFYADSGVTFTFDPAVLGGYPTHAGVVWTDGGGTARLEAFDRYGRSLGSTAEVPVGDAGIFTGETGEDRFFGVVCADGISAIRLWNGGGTELDHLQFGVCTGEVSGECPPSNTVIVACSLAPALTTNTVGQSSSVTVTVTSNGVARAGVTVTFNLTGANGTVQTNLVTAGNGQATFTYTGLNTGTDNILAAGAVGAQEFACDAVKVWLSAPPTNQPPTALCRNITTNANANCQAAVPASAVDNGSFDPDGTIVARVLSPAGPYPKGVTGITLTITDNNGATSSCSATITVVDNTPPSITCPPNVITNVPAGATGAVVFFNMPQRQDNCDDPGATTLPVTGSFFPLGTTTVTGIVYDDSGNTNTCTFTVTVNEAGCECPDLSATWSNLVQTCKFKNEVPACKVKGTLLVSNLGCVAAPTTFIRYYLSDDAVFDEGDTFLKQVATGTIKLDKPKKRTLSAKLPVGVNGAGKYILAVLDADQTLTECNENNNVVVFGPVP
jgi:hypothetical protein